MFVFHLQMDPLAFHIFTPAAHVICVPTLIGRKLHLYMQLIIFRLCRILFTCILIICISECYIQKMNLNKRYMVLNFQIS